MLSLPISLPERDHLLITSSSVSGEPLTTHFFYPMLLDRRYIRGKTSPDVGVDPVTGRPDPGRDRRKVQNDPSRPVQSTLSRQSYYNLRIPGIVLQLIPTSLPDVKIRSAFHLFRTPRPPTISQPPLLPSPRPLLFSSHPLVSLPQPLLTSRC